MSKYYKEEDLQRALIGFVRETGIDEKPFEYAANVLDNLQTIEVSEDCISREYLLSKVYDMDNDNLVVDLKDIEDAPSVVPSRAEGEWISKHNGYWTCSECGLSFLFYAKGNYCPNCGADMRGGKDD